MLLSIGVEMMNNNYEPGAMMQYIVNYSTVALVPPMSTMDVWRVIT